MLLGVLSYSIQAITFFLKKPYLVLSGFSGLDISKTQPLEWLYFHDSLVL